MQRHTPFSTPTRIAAAAMQALKHSPKSYPAQPVESAPQRHVKPNPAPGNAAMSAMATALASANTVAVSVTKGRERHEEPAKSESSTDSRAGEVAVGAFDAHPDDQTLRNRKLAVLVGSRIVAARELSGVQQSEFSRAIGHKTPAQPSLWETGRRLVPLADVPNVARVLGVSSDFLLGLSDEPDRDPAVARRSLLTQHLRDQVEVFAGHMAEAVLESGAEVEGALRSTKLLSRCQALQSAVDRFKAANADRFDDMPAGALLLRSARELAEAVEVVATELDGVGRRRERAVRKAKAAMGCERG